MFRDGYKKIANPGLLFNESHDYDLIIINPGTGNPMKWGQEKLSVAK